MARKQHRRVGIELRQGREDPKYLEVIPQTKHKIGDRCGRSKDVYLDDLAQVKDD